MVGEPFGVIFGVGKRLGRTEWHQLDGLAVGKARRQRDLRMRRHVALLERELLPVLRKQKRDEGARGVRVLRRFQDRDRLTDRGHALFWKHERNRRALRLFADRHEIHDHAEQLLAAGHLLEHVAVAGGGDPPLVFSLT